MQGIKKRQERLYTEDSQNTSKQKKTSRLTTVASLTFSQTQGTLEINSLLKNREFLISPRYRASEFQRSIINPHLQPIDSSLSLNPQVREIDIQQLLQTMKMVKFLAVNNWEQQRYIAKKQQSNNHLTQKMEEKEYRVESNKLKIQKDRALLLKKKHQAQQVWERKGHILNKDIFEMNLSIAEMQKKLTRKKNSQTIMAIKNKKIQETNSMASSHHFTSKMRIPIDNADYKQYRLEVPSHRHLENSLKFPFFGPTPKMDCNKIKQIKISENENKKQGLKENVKQLDKQYSYHLNEAKDSRSSQNKIRDSITSNKWKNNDNEDQELVQLLSNSIKKVQSQNSMNCKPYQLNKQKEQNQKYQNVREEQIITFIDDNSSVVNITYESQDKKHSKSQDSKEDIDPIKQIIKRKESAVINQSPVKIDVEISNSKVSSQKSDHSKTGALFSKFQSSLQQNFSQIDEESEELASLKNTPLQERVNSNSQRSSSIQPPKNSKLRNTENFMSLSPAELPLKNPPNLLEVDDLSESVQMQYSAMSKQRKQQGKYSQTEFIVPQSTGESEQDILDSINLLNQSKISREKAKQMNNASSLSWSIPNKREGEQITIKQDDEAEIEPFTTSTRILSKTSGSAIQQSIVRNRSITAMNRFTVKNINDKLSLPIEQVQDEQDEKFQSN